MKKKGGKTVAQPSGVKRGGQFTKQLPANGMFDADKISTDGKKKK